MTTAAQARPTIIVDHVSKRFRIPREPAFTIKERVLHPVRHREYDELDALQDVAFEINEGEFFGIAGRNGSGKSTLMKCVAGIYRSDSGSIRVRGRVAAFIELGVGFNPDLTARENVVINAAMLGLSPAEARRSSTSKPSVETRVSVPSCAAPRREAIERPLAFRPSTRVLTAWLSLRWQTRTASGSTTTTMSLTPMTPT